MENISKYLREAWNNIKYYDNGSLQLNISHPLEWYVSYETPTNKALVIISHFPIDNLDSSKSINTICNERPDGRYYISFRLVENSQEDVFVSMGSDLIEFSSNTLSEKDALKKVTIRYKQWRRLMEHTNLAVLSDEKRRGLIGELLYLQSIIEGKKPIKEALDGWVGPEKGDQDFVYEGRWREIKTTSLSSDSITIHSVEQLGNKCDEGELHIYRIEKCAPETEGMFTLPRLIKYFTSIFDGDLGLLESFTNKLSAVGYIDMDIYDKYYYKYYNKDIYDVNGDFPRITRADVRPEIIETEYVLSISSIDNWKRG